MREGRAGTADRRRCRSDLQGLGLLPDRLPDGVLQAGREDRQRWRLRTDLRDGPGPARLQADQAGPNQQDRVEQGRVEQDWVQQDWGEVRVEKVRVEEVRVIPARLAAI